MNLRFEIVDGHNEPRAFKGKNGETRFWRQIAYADLGGPYPVKIQVSVEHPLSPGIYVGRIPFRIGSYDALEVNPFEPWVVRPAKPEEVKKV